MFSVKPNTARRALQTCVVVLLAALATVSVAAFAQQGSNKSANSQQHAPGADYSHRTRSPAIIPDIPGFQEGGRPNYGGCDAADVTMGRNGCGELPRPPVCTDPNASNRGAPLPCQCNAGFVWNGSACQNTICRDDKAPNYGKPLPCEPPCPAGQVVLAGQCVPDPQNVCLIPGNPGYGGPLPCPLCQAPKQWVSGVCITPPPPCDHPWGCDDPCSYDTPWPGCNAVGNGAGWSCPDPSDPSASGGRPHYIGRCQG